MPEDSRQNDIRATQDHRLTDGRSELGDEFANSEYGDRQKLGNSFADPNSSDDTKLGNSFQQTNSSAKKHHRPISETVEAPFKKPGSKRILFLTLLGIAVVFLLILFFGWLPRHHEKQEAAQNSKREQQDPVVEVTRVSREKATGGLVVPGTTIPYVEASIYARANGYLKSLYVDIGDHVHKGQLLGIIDAPDLDQQVDQAREQLRQAESQVAQQETQLALTKVTVDRYRALVERGVFSRQDGDQREADYQAQRANVAAADRNVEAFKANLRRVIALQGYERVTAPFDGVVTQRNVDVGALINASGGNGGSAPSPMQSGQQSASVTSNGQTNTSGSTGSSNNLATPQNTGGGGGGGPLFSIAKVDQLRIVVSVPEGYAASVRPGTHASLHFQEFPDQVFYGDVSRNSASIDQNTRTLLTEIVVKNTDSHLLAGMYAVVTFDGAKGEGPLVVSGDAVGIRQDRPTVAVIENDKVRLTPVTLGRDYGPEVEIVAGLRDGDVIASTFTDEVIEGHKIKPQMNKDEAQKLNPPQTPQKPTPPGGSTQYGDPGIIDQDMQGQNAKPQQKQSSGGARKAAGKSGTQN